MSNNYSHEDLDILDALKEGNADQLFNWLLDGNSIHPDIKAHINALVVDKGYQFKFQPSSKSVGRPQARKNDIGLDIEWFLIKDYLVKIAGMKSVDAENLIAKIFATNFTYTTEGIRRGKNLILLLEKNGSSVDRFTEAEITKKYPELFSDT